ncbi:MAG: hypothetical protein QXH10_09460 [Ignisphaera sp.]
MERGYDILAIHHKTLISIEHENLKKIRLDIRNIENFKSIVLTKKPNVIVHMVALGDVDLCESDKSSAWGTMAEPIIALAR